MIYILILLEVFLAPLWAKPQQKMPSVPKAQAITYQNGSLFFKISKTDKQLAIYDNEGLRHLPIRSCNKKAVNEFWTYLSKTSESVHTLRGPASKSKGKKPWLKYKGKKKSVLSFEPARRKLNKIPDKTWSLVAQSQRLCHGARRPGSQETVSATVEVSPVTVVAGTPMQQCVETLCPDAKYSYSAITQKISDSLLGVVELLPIIRQTIEAETESEINSNKALLEMLKKTSQINDPVASRLFDAFYVLGHQIGELEFKHDALGKVVLDEEKIRAQFPQLSSEEFKKLITKGNGILRILVFEPIASTDPQEIALRYPGDGFKALIDNHIKVMREKLDRIKADPTLKVLTLIPTFENLDNLNEWREKFSGEINPQDIDDFNSQYQIIDLMDSIIGNGKLVGVVDDKPIDVQAKMKEMKVEENILAELAHYEKVQKQLPIENADYCAAAYARGEVGLPTKDEIKRMQARAPQLKKNFMDKIKGHMSAHSFGVVSERSQRWFFQMPQSKDNFHAALKRSLEKNRDEEISDKDSWKVTSSSPVFLALGLLIKPDEEEKVSSEDVCENMLPDLVPDASLGSTGGVAVGPLVTRFGAKAEGIFYHELGHNLSYELKQQGISAETQSTTQNIKQCLGEMHPESSAGGYVEEDFADLMSAQVESPDQNWVCLFNRQNVSTDYAALTIVPAEGDDHSANFARLLFNHEQKQGSLPEICHQALREKGETRIYKRCLP